MSIKQMQIVWDSDLPTTRKIVMLSLADQANDAGECYPSIATIMRRTSLSRRAVFDALSALENDLCLERESRPGRGGVMFRLTNPCTWRTGASDAPVRQTHGCSTRTSAAAAPAGAPRAPSGAPRAPSGAPGAPPIKQPPTNPQLTTTQPSAGARDEAGDGDSDVESLNEHEQQLVRPLLGHLSPGANVDLRLLASFVDHVGQKPGLVLSVAWYAQLSQQIAALARAGHDVNESIRRTIAAGNCVQLLVPKARDGPNASKSRTGTIRENYEEVDYR